MFRIFLLTISLLFFSFPAIANPEGCGEYAIAAVKYYKEKSVEAFLSPDEEYKKKILYLLEARHWEVKKHEEAHYNAAEGWAYPPIYYKIYVPFAHTNYIVSGCVYYKEGIPDHILFKSAIAPDNPSKIDQEIAVWALEHRKPDITKRIQAISSK